MSGASVSSSWSARAPSADTIVSNPRTDRLDRIRSTMFGSSSTSRARVLATPSDITIRPHPRCRRAAGHRPYRPDGRHGRHGRGGPGAAGGRAPVPGPLPHFGILPEGGAVGGQARRRVRPPCAIRPAGPSAVPLAARTAPTAGSARSGLAALGVARSGVAPLGLAPSGVTPSGVARSGPVPSGVTPSGLAPSGLAPSRLAPSARPLARPGASTGSRISKLAPSGGRRGRIRPPCATTIPWAIDSPRPAPALAECPRRFGSNGAVARSGGSPEPSSLTPITTSPPRPGSGRDADPGPGRVVPDRVVEQVDEHLFQPVMVGPDGRQRVVAGDLDH